MIILPDDINGVIASLEKASKALFEQFENKLLKNNADKCHLLLSFSDAVSLRVSEYDIKNSECEKLLGVMFENKLKFEKHVTDICRKTSTKNLCTSKNRSLNELINASFNPHFKYCPLIRMCHNRMKNRKINRLHERCLRIIMINNHLSKCSQKKTVQCLATEMYKVTGYHHLQSTLFLHKKQSPIQSAT